MSVILRIAGYTFLVLLLIAGGYAAVNWRTVHQIAKFSPILIPPMYGEPADQTEARAQDIRYLRKLINIDRSFSDEEREAFLSLLTDLEARAGKMTDAELYLAASRAAALADNGHTNVGAGPLYRRFKVIGAKFYWFKDGLYVVRADAAHGDAVGGRVLAIDGMPIADIAESLSRYRGGVPHWRRLMMPMMIESPEILHAAGLTGSPEAYTVSLAMGSGNKRDIVFEGTAAENGAALPVRRPWMTLKPVALPGEDEGWIRAISVSGDAVPLYLRDSNQSLYAVPVSGNGFYIRTQTAFDTGAQSITGFYRQTLSKIGNGELDYLVVDLRWNPGGDYTRAIEFAKQAPAKIKKGGRLYIAVGPQTFSAGLVTAALLKYYGGEKSLLIGTPMGDRAQFWAETGMTFTLPNSKFRINYATGFHDWNKGCEGHPFCFTQNLMHQVPAGSLAPAVTIAPAFSDYASGRDVVMDWIRSHQASSG